jgi:hypothetical protein
MAIQQLRIYEVDRTKRDAFLRRFELHAMRIMRERYGFVFLGLWESADNDALTFVYLLQWPDRETLDRQWEAFIADPEWERVKQEVRAQVGGEPVQHVTSLVLDEVSFSPHLLAGSLDRQSEGSNT